jgi:hypothetical protein
MSTPSLLNIPYLYKAGTLYSQIPESGAGDFTVSRTTTVANRSTRINKDGFIETVLDNVPRLDYPLGGAVNGCPALLVEPAATNEIRNNSNTNAVTGTPGTLPTNWTETLAGLTRSVIALGAENGVQYIDIRLSGTATAIEALINFESPTQIVASNGQVWTNSCFLKTISAANPYTGLRLSTVERTSGGIFVASGNSPDLTLTSTLNRFSFTRTLSGGGTVARVQSRISFGLVIGTAYNFTVRIGYPQMELGSVATSVIPTTTAAVTRSEDLIQRLNVPSLIGQTEGTFYYEGEANFASSDLPFLNRSVTNSILLAKNVSNQLVAYVYYGGVFLPVFATPSPITGPFKIAVGYKQGSPGDTAVFVNGVQVGTTNTTSWAFTGALNNVIVRTDGYIGGAKPYKVRALGVYPNRLSNTELQTLTTP